MYSLDSEPEGGPPDLTAFSTERPMMDSIYPELQTVASPPLTDDQDSTISSDFTAPALAGPPVIDSKDLPLQSVSPSQTEYAADPPDMDSFDSELESGSPVLAEFTVSAPAGLPLMSHLDEPMVSEPLEDEFMACEDPIAAAYLDERATGYEDLLHQVMHTIVHLPL